MKLERELIQYMRDWLYDYINHNCIYRVKPDEEPLPPLHPSHAPDGYTWLILSRRGLLNGKFLNFVGLLFWDQLEDKYKEKPFQIAGLETACIPIMSAIAMTAPTFGIEDLNCFYVRKKEKEYGLKQRFEGFIEPDKPVLVVDDFYNSRSTFLVVKHFIEQEGLELHENAFAIINKQWELYDNKEDEYRLKYKAESEGIDIISLFNITDFELSYNKYMLKYAPVNEQLISDL